VRALDGRLDETGVANVYKDVLAVTRMRRDLERFARARRRGGRRRRARVPLSAIGTKMPRDSVTDERSDVLIVQVVRC